LGVGRVPYSPLGRGFLTGTVTAESLSEHDFRRTISSRFSGDNLAANARVADAVGTVAAAVGATPAQVCLAWLVDKGRTFGLPVVPIPGTRSRHRIEENPGAPRVRLEPEHVAASDAVAATVAGVRSVDPLWVSSGRE
jgi:aryl-alcohol dehydrogenase-like predicted oxidoreductase